MFVINSYEFEVAAKNAVIRLIGAKVPKVTIKDMELMFFNRHGDIFSSIIACPKILSGYMFSVTFFSGTGNMYVQVLEEKTLDKLEFKDLDFKVSLDDGKE